MYKKLPVGEFEWVHPESYTEDLIKNYDENGDPKELFNKHKGIQFLPKRRQINGVENLLQA